MDARSTRRRKRLGLTTALGLAVTAALGVTGAASAFVAPPATNPQVAAVQGGWEGELMSAQDRPDCLGSYTATESTSAAFDTFRESKETYFAGFGSSDSRFSSMNAVFYLHMLREISPGVTDDNGAVDGTYALFDTNGLAIAQGVIQGVTHSSAASESTLQLSSGYEAFDGLLYGGQVLRPSGATIGIPHLVANFEGAFENYGDNHVAMEGQFGGNNSEGLRPAVVVGGSCPGTYKVRPLVLTGSGLSAKQSSKLSALSPALKAREAAYVQSLYERGGH